LFFVPARHRPTSVTGAIGVRHGKIGDAAEHLDKVVALVGRRRAYLPSRRARISAITICIIRVLDLASFGTLAAGLLYQYSSHSSSFKFVEEICCNSASRLSISVSRKKSSKKARS